MGLIGPIRGRGVSLMGHGAKRGGPTPVGCAKTPPLGISPTPEVEGRVAPLLGLYKEG